MGNENDDDFLWICWRAIWWAIKLVVGSTIIYLIGRWVCHRIGI